MKSIAIISCCSIVLLLAVINYCEAKNIMISAKLAFNPKLPEAMLFYDEDQDKVSDIVKRYCQIQRPNTCKADKQPKVRNGYGIYYKLDKTIKEAGIKRDQMVYIVY